MTTGEVLPDALQEVSALIPKPIWNLAWRLIDRGNDKNWTELHD